MAKVVIAGYSGTGLQSAFEIQLNTMGHDVYSISLPDETDTSLEAIFKRPDFPKDIDLIILESDAHGNAAIPIIRKITETVLGKTPPILAYSVSGNALREDKFLAEGASEVWIIQVSQDLIGSFREKIGKYIPNRMSDTEGRTYLADPQGLRMDL